jgi:Fanconi anemia group M protein
MHAPEIIVDQRERNTELLKRLEELGVRIALVTLNVGDYVISDRICIERKTVPDFEGSIINGRLFDQLGRLREHYSYPMLLLEGDRDAFRMRRRAITGAVASLYVRYGIPVIMSESPTESAAIMESIARQEQDSEERLPSLKGGAKAYTSTQFQEFVVGNLPGVGPKLAKSLLKHFHSVRRIANAEVEELMEVDKVGEKKARLIHETLNGPYEGLDDGGQAEDS